MLTLEKKKANKETKKNLNNQISQKNNEFTFKNKMFNETKEKRDKILETIEMAEENKKIFQEVINERKRFLMSSYLMRGQDDLEQILQTLHDHFYLIKLTSFEHLAKNNPENKCAKDLLDFSNYELKNLNKTLELL